MESTIKSINFLSNNNINKISGKIYVPNCEIKGIVQIVHGMCEYLDKYKKFTEFLLKNGYIVCGHDHLGHGKSINAKEDLGFFAERYGYKCLVKDTVNVTKIVKEMYPGYKVYVMGHSMGSFISRILMYDYGDIYDGVILSGTIGPVKRIDAGIKFIDLLIRQKGKRYRSKELTQIGLNISNIRIKCALSKYSWTSTDIDIVKEHEKDKLSNFEFTLGGYRDLLYLVKLANDESKIKNMRKDLPIYMFSGDEDPIGDYGRGVQKIYDVYKKNKCNIQLAIYKKGRHEMLTDLNYQKVYDDILKWIRKK